MFPDDTLLRKALLANAVFSGASAIVLVAAAGPVSRILGSVAPVSLYVIGAGLALFALELARQARSDTLRPTRAFGATLADLAWVAGSAVLLVVRPEVMSGSGLLVVAVVAGIVLALAVLQLEGLRRYARNHRGGTDVPSMFSLTRRLEVPADRVWEQLQALERIDEFYYQLAGVEVGENNDRTIRTCVDRRGRRWSEEVLTMDGEARSLTLRFVTEADDFPFPMTLMIGGWTVTPRNGGSDLTLWYEYALPGGVLGEVAAALLAPSLEERMAPVVQKLGEAAARMGAADPGRELPA